MRILFVIIVLSLLCACGGGGGGSGSDTKSFAGDWYGTAQLLVNDCSLPIPTVDNIAHRVNQNTTEVVVDIMDGTYSYRGNLDADGEGFSVYGENKLLEGTACVMNEGVRYENLDGDTATVAVALMIDCPDGSSCDVGYAGTVSR
jgi:hypothetical protein